MQNAIYPYMWLSAIEKAFLGGKEKNELEEAPDCFFFMMIKIKEKNRRKKKVEKTIY